MKNLVHTELIDKFKSLVNSNYKKFYKYACFQLNCKETAKDIVQESLITAYQKLDSFQSKSSLETWVLGILNNKILEYYRNKQKEQKYIDTDTEEIVFNKNGSWKKEWMNNTAFEVEHKETEKEYGRLLSFLNECLSILKNQHRQIIFLKFYLNKKTEDICNMCQIKEDNVWQIIHRSKLQLKICIQSKLKKENG